MISTDLLHQFSVIVLNEDANEDAEIADTLWDYVAGLNASSASILAAALAELAAARQSDRDIVLESIGFAWSIEGDEPAFFLALAEAVTAIAAEQQRAAP